MKTFISALAALALLAGGAAAQTAATMIPGTDAPFLDTSSGQALPCVGCTISSFAAGTNTPARTYVDSTLTTQNNTVITLDSAGYSPSGIWIGASCYKFLLKSAQGVTLRTQDHICDNAIDLRAALAGATGAAQIGYEAAGSSTLRTVAAKLGEVVSVEDFGATGNGTTNDSAACQAAETYVSALGGIVQFGPHTYVCNFLIDSNVWIRGAGVGATTIKSATGSNLDVLKGRHFAALTDTPIQGPPETRGDNFTRITDLTVDGNKSGNATGYGVRVWGHSMYWESLTVQNCATGGIWTEYSDGSGANYFAANPKLGDPEAWFGSIKTTENIGNGWTFQGPNDSVIRGLISTLDTGWGIITDTKQVGPTIYHLGTLEVLSAANCYGEGIGCYKAAANATILNWQSVTASDSPICITTDATDGSMHMYGMIVAGCTTYGIYLQGDRNIFSGSVSQNTIGMILQNAINNQIFLHGDTNGLALQVASESGANSISGVINVPAVLSDATSGGVFTGVADHNYYVQVVATGTPDKFQWQRDDVLPGAWTGPVNMTGGGQTLSDGVTITFAATTGHTAGSTWAIDAVAVGPTTGAATLNQLSAKVPDGSSFSAFVVGSTVNLNSYGNKTQNIVQIPSVLATASGQTFLTIRNQLLPNNYVQIYHTGNTGDGHVEVMGAGDLYLGESPAVPTHVGQLMILSHYAVASLPACTGASVHAQYGLAMATDLTSTTSGATATGGGALLHLVACSGSAWIVQ